MSHWIDNAYVVGTRSFIWRDEDGGLVYEVMNQPGKLPRYRAVSPEEWRCIYGRQDHGPFWRDPFKADDPRP